MIRVAPWPQRRTVSRTPMHIHMHVHASLRACGQPSRARMDACAEPISGARAKMAAASAGSMCQLGCTGLSRPPGAVYSRTGRLPEHALTLFPPSAGALRGLMRCLGQTADAAVYGLRRARSAHTAELANRTRGYRSCIGRRAAPVVASACTCTWVPRPAAAAVATERPRLARDEAACPPAAAIACDQPRPSVEGS